MIAVYKNQFTKTNPRFIKKICGLQKIRLHKINPVFKNQFTKTNSRFTKIYPRLTKKISGFKQNLRFTKIISGLQKRVCGLQKKNL